MRLACSRGPANAGAAIWASSTSAHAAPAARDRRSRHGPLDRQCVLVAMALVYSHASADARSEEHTSELQSRSDLVCRLLLEKKKNKRRDARSLRPSRPAP